MGNASVKSAAAGFAGTLWRANLHGLLAGGEPSPISGLWPAAHQRVRARGGSPSSGPRRVHRGIAAMTLAHVQTHYDSRIVCYAN